MKIHLRPKTDFSIPGVRGGGGHRLFLKMPFGLCTTGVTFDGLMERVFANLFWKVCFVHMYLDDIILLSKTFDENLRIWHKFLRG